MKLRIAVVLLLLILCLPIAQGALSVGDQALDFTLLSHYNTYYTLYDYWGDVVVMNFSTMW